MVACRFMKPTTTVTESVLDLVERRRLALDAEVDLRTLARALGGHKVRPASMHRIRRELALKGLAELLPTSEADR